LSNVVHASSDATAPFSSREQLFEFFGGEAGHERFLAVDGRVDRRAFFLLQPGASNSVRLPATVHVYRSCASHHVLSSGRVRDIHQIGNQFQGQILGGEVVGATTKGKLDFGPWEQIFHGESDGRRRKPVWWKLSASRHPAICIARIESPEPFFLLS
jgi:hypothetical protein